MALAEELYQRARRLPDDKIAEVLDFIGYIETVLERSRRDDQLSPPISKKLATSATIPVIEDEAPADDWPEPIHGAHWDDHISLRREDKEGRVLYERV
ncbi:MAG: hypothetical protein HQL75_07435 [Magnetococcales bacterium]|nr:hypothetical protein [Magnetococcales bacterium]